MRDSELPFAGNENAELRRQLANAIGKSEIAAATSGGNVSSASLLVDLLAAATTRLAAIDVADTAPSAPSSAVATVGAPGALTASVAFVTPASTGGSAITGYTVTSSPGGLTGTGASSPITVTGLTKNTAYTFTVTATNAVGTSAASAASAAVTPVGVPNAPTAVVGTAGDEEVSVAFSAPANNGGSAITLYTVTSSPGAFTATGAASPIVVTGLTNETPYTFTVKATNVAGQSSASAASASATPTAG